MKSKKWNAGDKCQWGKLNKKGDTLTVVQGVIDSIVGESAFVKQIGKNTITKIPVSDLRQSAGGYKTRKFEASEGVFYPSFSVELDVNDDPLCTAQDNVSWAVLHELDLFDEGQDTNVLTVAEANEARCFLMQFPPFEDYPR